MNPVQHVGADVSAKNLEIAGENARDGSWELQVPNTPQGHQKLIQRLRRCAEPARVCLESTGVYGLGVALALHAAENIEVMVLNPRAARHFAKALMRRSKTDPIDAAVLREYCQRMEFKPWCPPAKELLQLRSLARRILALTTMKTEEKNRRHAAKTADELPCIRNDIEVNIRHFKRRIERLRKEAAALIDRYPPLQVPIARLTSVKGIGLASAVSIYGELSVLPADMTPRQWVAHAGLDPRHFESGKFIGKTRISKAGNKYLRAALYMPALSAKDHEPNVRAFYEMLLGRGKEKMQGVVAVMRKLLHAIHGMLRHNANFDGEKFYAMAAKKA